MALTNSSGAVTEQTTYDSFGNPTNINFSSRYQYTGREFDSFTGLNYYRARWYDGNLGRFISEDPIGFGGGDVNLYGYVWNNPGSFTDPMGLDVSGNDVADWVDARINTARPFYIGDSQEWIRNGSVDTVADIASLAADPLRVGSGLGDAIYNPNLSGWQRAGAVGTDVLRATVIAGLVARLGSAAVSALSRFRAPADAIKSCPLPYAKGRPSYGKGQVETVWENAKTPDGRVFDPYTREELFWDKTSPRNGQWDMGHVPEMRYRDYHSQYMNGRITKDTFQNIHRNPSNYRPQSVRTNRSSRYP